VNEERSVSRGEIGEEVNEGVATHM
jgi:hypothetical protein